MPVSPNNNGDNGNGIYQFAGDLFVTVGSDYNSYPSTSENPQGISVPVKQVTEAGGQMNFSSVMTQYKEISSGHLFQTGSINFFGGNSFNIETGGGGINLDTGGNIHLNAGGGMVSIVGNASLDVATNTVQMTAAEGMRMSSDQMMMDSKDTSFSGNVAFDKNLKLQGSLAVQGEFYPTHMTTQKQPMITDEAEGTSGSLNPIQSFYITNGSSSLATAVKALGVVGRDMIPPPVPTIGTVETILDMGLIATNPELVAAITALSTSNAAAAAPAITLLATLISGPINVRVAFPNGVHLISNQAVSNDKDSVIQIATMDGVTGGNMLLSSVTDFFGPSHHHVYYIPACTLLNSTDEVWKAASACDSEEAGHASPMQVNGQGTADLQANVKKIINKRIDIEKKRIKKQLTGALDKINPFSDSTGS